MIPSMPHASADEWLSLARRLVEQAADLSVARFGTVKASLKPDKSVVTHVDHDIQRHLVNAIAEACPEHAIIAEEHVEPVAVYPSPTTARFCWVIDPLDGTRNYVLGVRCFSTSIALLDRGRPILGVVLEHNLRDLYVAVLGRGTRRNGTPVRVLDPPDGDDLLVGFPSSKDSLAVAVTRAWAAERGLIARNLGSTALQLGLVASGAMAATFAKRSKIWDEAAGALLVTEAGGRFTDASGRDPVPFDLATDPQRDLPFLAGAPRAHARLLPTLAGLPHA